MTEALTEPAVMVGYLGNPMKVLLRLRFPSATPVDVVMTPRQARAVAQLLLAVTADDGVAKP